MKKHFLLAAWLLSTFTLLADKVDALIKDEMKKHEIPGLALTVIKNGRPFKTAAYGFSNLELNTPATRETAFEIGSVTKQFTAAGLMMLVQEGKLSVDDLISQHLKNTPPIWSKITVRHLLTHTSGIKTYTGLDGFELSKHLSQEEFIKKIGAQPLDFEPGEKWNYCNTGFNLIGFIIENVSGQKYWDYMNERIFRPLDMKATMDRDPMTIVPNRADGYEKNAKGVFGNRDYDLTDIFSAGAIASSIDDMAKWEMGLDSSRFLTDASKEAMWTSTRLSGGGIKTYGFAWNVDRFEGHKYIWHGGSTSGFSATFQRFPDDKITIIILCNSGENGIASTLAKKIAPIYLRERSVSKK